MIIAIREDGEVRIFESEEEVLHEWGPYPRDVESDVVIFYTDDGTWLKPVFTEGPRSSHSTFRLVHKAAADPEYEDPIGLALYEARTLVPNRHFGSLVELRAKFPFSEALGAGE